MAPNFTMRLVKNVHSAALLHKWELNSDDIYDETKAQWLSLIRKTFPLLIIEHDFVPKHRKSWHKVYDLYNKLEAEKVAADTQKMIQHIAARDELKQARQVAVVSGDKYINLEPHRNKSAFVPKTESKSFFAKTRKSLRLDAARFKIVTPAATRAFSTKQIKGVPESVRTAHRIASQPGVLDVNERRALELERAAEAEKQRAEMIAARREAMEKRAQLAAPKAQPYYTVVGNVVSFDDDGDEDGENSANPAEAEDDLFGDHPSRDASPDTLNAATPKPSAKRARDSTDSAVLDRPAKRFRSPSEEPRPVPQAPKSRLPSVLVSAPPSKSDHFIPAAKRRRKGLSAAPGANSAQSTSLRMQLLKAPAKHNPTTTTSPPPASSSSSKPASPAIASQPPRNSPTLAPRTPPHQPTTPAEGGEQEREHPTEAEKRCLRHKDGSLTPQKCRTVVPARRVKVCLPMKKLK